MNLKNIGYLVAMGFIFFTMECKAEPIYLALQDVYMVRVNQTSIDNKVFPVTIFGYQQVRRFDNPGIPNQSAPKQVGLGISASTASAVLILNRCLALAQNMMNDRLLIEQATATTTSPQTLTLEIGGSIGVDNLGRPIGTRVENETSIHISNFVVSGCVLNRGSKQ